MQPRKAGDPQLSTSIGSARGSVYVPGCQAPTLSVGGEDPKAILGGKTSELGRFRLRLPIRLTGSELRWRGGGGTKAAPQEPARGLPRITEAQRVASVWASQP